jgi:4-hydroxymandelate oxidase
MESENLITIADYERQTRSIVGARAFNAAFGDYGAPEYETNSGNVDAFRRLTLRPRVLTGRKNPTLSTTALGQAIDLPLIVAPVGMQRRWDPSGELATARAAASARTVMAVSVMASSSLEEIASVATGPLWFQMYVFKDKRLDQALIRRAEAAGYRALVVTVDNIAAKSWERERRYGQGLLASAVARADPREARGPADRRIPNLMTGGRAEPPTLDTFFEALESELTWAHLDWVRSLTTLPVIVKGIQTAEDALICCQRGFAALVVSNHGGHALNGARPAVDALREVVDAVGSQIEVYLDGGVRHGTDVLKALALGARAVLVGRAPMWGLCVAGEAGVTAVFNVLRTELEVATALCGLSEIQRADRSLLGACTQPQSDARALDLECLARLYRDQYITLRQFSIAKERILGQARTNRP